MLHIDDENKLIKRIVETKGVLLLNFWSDWSIQCHNMAYVMRRIDALLDTEDAIACIDWHRQKQLAKKLEVFGVPTLVIYFSGQEVARFSGTMSELVLLKRVGAVKKSC